MNKLYKSKFYEKMKLMTLVMTTLYVGVLGATRKETTPVQKVIFFCMAVVALMKFRYRDYYLPFLGDAVFPNELLGVSSPMGYNTVVEVKVPKDAKVVYWAALENDGTKGQMPWKAYGNYSNSGVTNADAKGKALLKVVSPRGYNKPWGKPLKPHVHYRYFKTNGMMSRVFTEFL